MILLCGYPASAFLAVSLMVTRAMWFRWINLLGCLTFVIYGALIDAFPVILANGILVVINIVQVVNLYTRKERFEHVQIHRGDEIVESFLKFYRKDIHLDFLEFQFTTDAERICFMVLRNATLANIFVARKAEYGNIVVEINYTVPKYRDYKVGQFIFEAGAVILNRAVCGPHLYKIILQRTHNSQRMGFRKILDG